MLTRRQHAALTFIAGYQCDTGGVSPSYRQIAAAIGLKSPSSMYSIVSALEERGFLRCHGHGKARCIEVLRPAAERGDSRMLTRRQHAALTFIAAHQRDTGGVSPSYRQIADAIGLKSPSGVYETVSALEERGFLRRLGHGKARCIEVLRLPAPTMPDRRARIEARIAELDKEKEHCIAALDKIDGDADFEDCDAEPEPETPPIRRHRAGLAA